jgi:hypothetical protein
MKQAKETLDDAKDIVNNPPAEKTKPVIVFCVILVLDIVLVYYTFPMMRTLQVILLVPSLTCAIYVLGFLRTGLDNGEVTKLLTPILGSGDKSIQLDDIGVMSLCISVAIVLCHMLFSYMNPYLQLVWIPATATTFFLVYMQFVLKRTFLPRGDVQRRLESDVLAIALDVSFVVGFVFGFFENMSPWLQIALSPALGFVEYETYRRVSRGIPLNDIHRNPFYLASVCLSVSVLLTYILLPSLPDVLAVIMAPAMAFASFFALNTYVFKERSKAKM